MVIVLLPSCGLRGLIKSLLSPRITTSDDAETSTPRYVCARKKYQSGRKGRACVYRVSGERTGNGGRKVRLYTNVEGVDLDDDERRSFAGIQRTMRYTKGRSPRPEKCHSSRIPRSVGKERLKAKRLAGKAHDASDEGSDSRAEGNGIMPSRARLLSASSDEVWDVPRHLRFGDNGKHIFCQSHNGSRSRTRDVNPREGSRIHRRKEAGRFGEPTSQAEERVRRRRDHYCSGALPIPEHRSNRPSLESAPILPSRKSRTAAANNTIKLVINPEEYTSKLEEHKSLAGEQNVFGVSEAPGSPFRQPGLTPQESSDLVFGASSQVETRRRLRAGRADDHITPDVHESASQLVPDPSLGKTQQNANAYSLSRNPPASDLGHTMLSHGEHEVLTRSRAPALINPSRTVLSTHGPTRATMPRFLPEQSLQPVISGIPGLVHSQAGPPFDRYLSTATPGTPPYTPGKAT